MPSVRGQPASRARRDSAAGRRLTGDFAPTREAPRSSQDSNPFPIWRSPEAHAQRLLEWLRDHRPGEVLAREIQAAYREMICELGWELGAWNQVAPRFRQLLGDRKHYRNFLVNGRRHRWCVYTLPGRLAGDSPAAPDRLLLEGDRATLAA